jgi:lysozyme family protein
MIDIIRKVGADVGVLEPEHANPIAALKASPLGRFNMKWIQETLAMPKLPGGTPNLKVDGVIGDNTHDAIKKFQTAHPPLEPDGWAGLQTLAALEMERKKLEA